MEAYYWMFGSLRLFAGGWRPPEGWEPPAVGRSFQEPPPERGTPEWHRHVELEYGFERLDTMVRPDESTGKAPIEVVLEEVFQGTLRTATPGRTLRVDLGGYAGEICPVLIIVIARYSCLPGSCLYGRSKRHHVVAIANRVLDDTGAGWVGVQQFSDNIHLGVDRGDRSGNLREPLMRKRTKLGDPGH